MQFRVVGQNPTADSLRALLRRAQLPLAMSAATLLTTSAFTIEIVDQEGPIVVDSIDSELDNLVRGQIQELLAYDLAVRHKTGEVHSDNLIRIEVASGSRDAEAVVTGVRRAIDLFLNGPALQRPAQSTRQQRAWIRYLILALAGLLLFFGGYVLRGMAQTQTPTGAAPIKQDLRKIGGTDVPAGIIDTPNTAIKVNCVIGCGAGGGLTDAELRATPVPVSGTFWQATQPVSGTFWQTIQPTSISQTGTNNDVDANITNSSIAVTGTFWPATQPVSGTFWQATQPVSGTFWQATQPISAATLPLPTGAATETTLGTRLAEATFTTRIPVNGQGTMAASVPVVIASNQSAVPVSGPLTDAQLRATPVPVSGTVTANAGSGTMAVSGPLTDAQLRATPPTVITKSALTANSPATVSVSTTSGLALASNAGRKGLLVINLSNATVCFGIGATAVLSSGICLQPSAAWSMNEYSFVTGAINAIASAAASTISIQEFQ